MLKRMAFILSANLFVAQLCLLPASAQEKRGVRASRKAVATKSSAREQDGLIGPVRRVRTEIAKILIESDAPVEGPRVLREMTTYDVKGNKIDNAYYPVEGSQLTGKEEYEYDAQGNIKQMSLRHKDGTILSRELYEYEFDAVGNWKKMLTRVAVVEGGKVQFEPTEVTYRTITYYYNQSVANAVQPSSPVTVAPTEKTATKIASETKAAPRPAAESTLAAAPKVTDKKELASQPSTAAPNTKEVTATKPSGDASTPDPAGNKVSDNDPARSSSSAIAEPPAVPTPKLPVKHVTSEALKSAVLSLPEPTYPTMALFARVEGKVEVQVIIDEKGEVSATRAISGHPLLNDAAEAAARRARFSPTMLSREPAKIFGVVSYNFTLPSGATPSQSSTASDTPPTASNVTTATAPKDELVKPDAVSAAVPLDTASKSTPAPNISTPADSAPYRKIGLSHYAAGRYKEAVEVLEQAIKLRPDDASAHSDLGLAYAALGRYKEAAESFEQALRLKREVVDAEAYYKLGDAYVNLDRPQQAIETFTQTIKMIKASAEVPAEPGRRKPTLAEAHYGLGMAYYNSKRYKQAIKAFEEVILYKPKLAQARYALGMAYIGDGDKKSAEKQQEILKNLDSALADRLTNALITPGVRGNKVF